MAAELSHMYLLTNWGPSVQIKVTCTYRPRPRQPGAFGAGSRGRHP